MGKVAGLCRSVVCLHLFLMLDLLVVTAFQVGFARGRKAALYRREVRFWMLEI